MTDSVSLRQDSFYEEQGITAISNNNAVVSRDLGGNILVQPTSSLLVIEAITTNVLAESVLPLLNTQFNYYRFPARISFIDESLDLDLDLDLDLNIQPADVLVPASNLVIPPLPSRYKPSSNQRINVGGWANPSVIELSTVVTGPAQIAPNSLVVTQELLDQLDAVGTETGKNPALLITGIIKTTYNKNNPNSGIGFSMGFANTFRRAIMSQPAGDLKDEGSSINKFRRAKKSNTYTTTINFTIPKSQLYVDLELQLRGWAEDNEDNKNHTILATDSYIQFDAGTE